MSLVGGAPVPAGAGVPTPVVNGQWIKGIGGAAVWAQILGTDVQPPQTLNIQRQSGTENNYYVIGTNTAETQMYGNGSGTVPIRLAWTPPVNAWWDVSLSCAIEGKNDAAYHYAYMSIALSPADVDGVSRSQHLVTQHSGVNQYEGRFCRNVFKLAANTAYTVNGIHGSTSGGNWSYYMGPDHLNLMAIGYSR